MERSAGSKEPRAMTPHEEMIVLETYDMIERLLVGKPGKLHKKNPVFSTAIHDALASVYTEGARVRKKTISLPHINAIDLAHVIWLEANSGQNYTKSEFKEAIAKLINEHVGARDGIIIDELNKTA